MQKESLVFLVDMLNLQTRASSLGAVDELDYHELLRYAEIEVKKVDIACRTYNAKSMPALPAPDV